MKDSELVAAAAAGNVQAITRLLQAGRKAIPDAEAAKALGTAAFNGHLEIVRMLIESGVDPNIPIEGLTPGRPALYQAIEGWQPEVVEYLLQHGAEVNIADVVGQTPLHHAIDLEADAGAQAHETPEAIFTAALVAHGADVNARTDEGETPLGWAIRVWHPAAEALLRAHGAVEGKPRRV